MAGMLDTFYLCHRILLCCAASVRWREYKKGRPSHLSLFFPSTCSGRFRVGDCETGYSVILGFSSSRDESSCTPEPFPFESC